jgi:hypothetical protein
MENLTTHYLSIVDLYAYRALIQHISSVEKDDNKYLEMLEEMIEEQGPTKFIMIVCDKKDQEKIYLTANITYTYRFTKNGVYDMMIQDMVYATADACPIPIPVDTLIKGFHLLMEEYETRHQMRVDKRILMDNHLLTPFHEIFKKRNYHLV